MIYPAAGPGPDEWSVWSSSDDSDTGEAVRTYRPPFASLKAQVSWALEMAWIGVKASIARLRVR
jgi:hypothetical protein